MPFMFWVWGLGFVVYAERLRDTLLHEMCHAAVWIIDKIKGGHGPAFKSWYGLGSNTCS